MAETTKEKDSKREKKETGKAKQTELTDSEGEQIRPSIPALDNLIEIHQEKMQARKDAGDEEKAAKDAVGKMLFKKELTFYKYAGNDPALARVAAELDPGETTVVIKKQPKKTKDEDDE